MTEDLLTRRNLRHHVMRRRNARIAETRDQAMPLALRMNPDTLTELLLDGDPAEQHTLDFEGREFIGIPVLTDPAMGYGDIAIDWPPLPDRAPPLPPVDADPDTLVERP
jgi:hypothetical protein